MKAAGWSVMVALLLTGLGLWGLVSNPAGKDGVTPPPAVAPTKAAIQPGLWLVWYATDIRVYRLQVPRPTYESFDTALRKAMAQDEERLLAIADGFLETEIEPVLATVPDQLNPFLERLFSLGNGAVMLHKALESAGTPAATLASVQTQLAGEVVKSFQHSLVTADTTLAALRGAAARTFAWLRQDLLYNCDRYDRAFREFVLTSPGTVETMERKTNWRPDPSWQQSTATFLSLCEGLRRIDVGHLADTYLQETLVAATRVQASAMEQVRPLAETAMGVEARTAAIRASWGELGLSRDWAQPLASGLSYAASSGSLLARLHQWWSRTQTRQAFATLLQAVLEQLRQDVRQRLHLAYHGFIEGEMGRIGVNLAVRSQGVWSFQ